MRGKTSLVSALLVEDTLIKLVRHELAIDRFDFEPLPGLCFALGPGITLLASDVKREGNGTRVGASASLAPIPWHLVLGPAKPVGQFRGHFWCWPGAPTTSYLRCFDRLPQRAC